MMKRVKRVLACLLVIATVFAFTPFLSYEAYGTTVGDLKTVDKGAKTITFKGSGDQIVLYMDDSIDYRALINTLRILERNGKLDVTKESDGYEHYTWTYDYNKDGLVDFSLSDQVFEWEGEDEWADDGNFEYLTALTDYGISGWIKMEKTVTESMTVPSNLEYWGPEPPYTYPYYSKLTFKFPCNLKKAVVTMSPSSGTLVYTGKARLPGIRVKYNGLPLTKGTDFKVSGSRVSIGPGKATITGMGNYTGTVTKSFKIVPSKVTISSVTGGAKKFTVKWGKRPGGVKYQIKYRVKGTSTWKNTTSTTTSKTVTGLTKGKTYEVKVRAYKTVSCTNYYGAFSAVKTVKVK